MNNKAAIERKTKAQMEERQRETKNSPNSDKQAINQIGQKLEESKNSSNNTLERFRNIVAGSKSSAQNRKTIPEEAQIEQNTKLHVNANWLWVNSQIPMKAVSMAI